MIGRLTGKLIEKSPPQIILDIQGVGYEVEVSMQTFYQLPNEGEITHLYTQLIVREDAHLLFGFADKEERQLFRQLIKVSGIGAKIALGVLSAMSIEDLAEAIAQEDVKRLSAAPGIGKKTAERMILELRGKLSSKPIHLVSNSTHSNGYGVINRHTDVIDTLLALGYTEREARSAVKDLPEHLDVSEGVRQALRNLVK